MGTNYSNIKNNKSCQLKWSSHDGHFNFIKTYLFSACWIDMPHSIKHMLLMTIKIIILLLLIVKLMIFSDIYILKGTYQENKKGFTSFSTDRELSVEGRKGDNLK